MHTSRYPVVDCARLVVVPRAPSAPSGASSCRGSQGRKSPARQCSAAVRLHEQTGQSTARSTFTRRYTSLDTGAGGHSCWIRLPTRKSIGSFWPSQKRVGCADCCLSIACVSMKQHLRNCSVNKDHQTAGQGTAIPMAFGREVGAEPILKVCSMARAILIAGWPGILANSPAARTNPHPFQVGDLAHRPRRRNMRSRRSAHCRGYGCRGHIQVTYLLALGFRTGNHQDKNGAIAVQLAFDASWDLRRIRPHFFPARRERGLWQEKVSTVVSLNVSIR